MLRVQVSVINCITDNAIFTLDIRAIFCQYVYCRLVLVLATHLSCFLYGTRMFIIMLHRCVMLHFIGSWNKNKFKRCLSYRRHFVLLSMSLKLELETTNHIN